jgi:alkyl hydroperoxide reductase subunit AhpC
LPSAIEQVQREFKDRGVVVLAVNIQESRETVVKWVRDKGLTSVVLLDRSGNVSAAYRVTATPTVFLIDRDANLVAKAIGTKPWTSKQGRALLMALTN